jgi:hypothetical protein
MQGGHLETGSGAIRRALGSALDDLVLTTVARLTGRVGAELTTPLRRVQLFPQSGHLVLDAEAFGGGDASDRLALAQLRLTIGETAVVEAGGTHIRIVLPVRVQTRGGRRWLQSLSAPRRTAIDRPLVKALKAAHKVAKENGLLVKDGTPDRGPTDAYQRRICILAFLAPDIQAAILEGRQPASLTLERLTREDIRWHGPISGPCWGSKFRAADSRCPRASAASAHAGKGIAVGPTAIGPQLGGGNPASFPDSRENSTGSRTRGDGAAKNS